MYAGDKLLAGNGRVNDEVFSILEILIASSADGRNARIQAPPISQ